MWYKERGNKYHAESSVYGGVYYQSKKEAAYAQELDLRVRARDIKSWVRQIPIELRVNGMLICKYITDFMITHNNGDQELVEIKGFRTDVFNIKWKLLEAIWSVERPEIKITMIQ